MAQRITANGTYSKIGNHRKGRVREEGNGRGSLGEGGAVASVASPYREERTNTESPVLLWLGEGKRAEKTTGGSRCDVEIPISFWRMARDGSARSAKKQGPREGVGRLLINPLQRKYKARVLTAPLAEMGGKPGFDSGF